MRTMEDRLRVLKSVEEEGVGVGGLAGLKYEREIILLGNNEIRIICLIN